MTEYAFRDPLVNITGLVLVGIIFWQFYLYQNGDRQQEHEAQKNLTVLIAVLVVYLFSVPVMYPQGDLWASEAVQLFTGTPSAGSSGTLTDGGIFAYIVQEEPTSTLDSIIFWLKVIGMVVHVVVFVLLSIFPRAVVVGYDNLLQVLGLDD